MKLQLTSLVTVAVLYGKVTASPIPTEELLPSVSDAALGGIGSLLSSGFQLLAPSATVNGALGAANACVQLPNGYWSCPQKRDVESEELLPSISDSILGGIGSLLSSGYQLVAPSAAVNGALGAANACVKLPNGYFSCPQKRDVESEELLPSISDAALGGIGNLLSSAFQLAAPSATVNGALGAANACVQLSNGYWSCPQKRDVESEELLPSISDSILGGLGSLISSGYQLVAPSAAVNGALGAANACVRQPNGYFYCPQS